MELMRERLASFGKSYTTGIAWGWTACRTEQEPTFRRLLENLKPTNILEIGTHQGVSTALLAEYGDVITVDILPNPQREKVWEFLGVTGRIEEHVHKIQDKRDAEIVRAAKLSDLAFIDGSHMMRDLEYDFGLVASAGCKQIILHDYWEDEENWPDVKTFTDRLVVTGLYWSSSCPNGFRAEVKAEIYKPFVYVEVL